MDAPENQIDYAAVLQDLEARKTAIEAAIAAVQAILGQPGAIKPATIVASTGSRPSEIHSSEIRPDSFFGMGVADAAKKYLALVKGPKTLKEIADGLMQGGLRHGSSNFSASLHTALTRRTSDFVRVKRGQWGLLEWYPGLRRGREQE